MKKITLCVEQTKSKLPHGVNYSNRDIISMPSFINDLLPNAISIQKYAQVVAWPLLEYLGRKQIYEAWIFVSIGPPVL